MIRPEPSADGARTRRSVAYALILLALLAVLLPRLADFWHWSALTIASPTGADYGEGIVWEQLIGLVQGQGFGPAQGIPAIVYHYTPLYHLVSAAVAPFTRDALQAGRLVSFLATIATALLLMLMTRRLIGSQPHRIVAWICAVLAAAMFLHFQYVVYWGPLMRVDPLAVLLTVAGLFCGMEALRRPKLIYASAILFVLAVYSKQTSVVAPVAVFGVLLFVRRSLALRGIAVAVALGLVLLAAMLAWTDGRFLKHVIGYNVNRFTVENLIFTLRVAKAQLDMSALLFAGAFTLFFVVQLRERWRWSAENLERSAAIAMLLGFMVLKTMSLVALGKSGASSNYWIEWLAPASVIIGLGLFACFLWSLDPLDGWRGSARRIAAFVLPVLLIAGQFIGGRLVLPDLRADEVVEQRLVATAKECHGWVIGDDMVAILRAGKRVVWEPAIFAELASLGVYDEKPVIEALQSHRICAVIVESDPVLVSYRFTKPIMAAIETSYTHHYVAGKWLVYY
jgi:hypothetical protein